MNIRDLIDDTRIIAVSDSGMLPSRQITYIRLSDLLTTTLNSYIGGGAFSKAERETIGQYESFGGISLIFSPSVGDIIQHNGIDWRVVRWTQMGQLYTVYCENKRHNGRPNA